MMQEFLNISKQIGCPISMEKKTEWATQLIVFLGILLNDQSLTLAVPVEKCHKAVNLLTQAKKGDNQVYSKTHWNPQFLPPANKACEGYVFIPVCQSFCSQGALPQCMLGYPPPEQTSPRSRHPPDQAPPYAVHAGRYSQQAGGTHPTRMQSCLNRAIVPGCKFTRGMYTKLTLEGKKKYSNAQRLPSYFFG